MVEWLVCLAGIREAGFNPPLGRNLVQISVWIVPLSFNAYSDLRCPWEGEPARESSCGVAILSRC